MPKSAWLQTSTDVTLTTEIMVQPAAVPPPKKTARKPAKPKEPTLAEIARDAADKAQREAILKALEDHDYSPSAVAETLDPNGGSGNIIRAMKRLGIYEQYLTERTRRRIENSKKA